MEVHAHTHTARKKWQHYFWEFLMLFLAVFCGFLAENGREHLLESHREEKYIKSMLEDLKSDTAWINNFINTQQWSVNAYDSVIQLLSQPKRDAFSQERLYYLIRMAMRSSWPNEANETSYEQMKNSGNLRLIHSQKITDSISKYYFKVKEIAYISTLITLRQQAVTEYEAKIVNGFVLHGMMNKKTFDFLMPEGNPSLFTNDASLINEFTVRIHYLVSIMVYSIKFAKEQNLEAANLIAFLQKEYELK